MYTCQKLSVITLIKRDMLLELLRFIFGFRGTKKAEREEGAGRGTIIRYTGYQLATTARDTDIYIYICT